MACRKNIEHAKQKKNKFPVQEKLWNLLYRKGTLKDAADALGKNPIWLSQVLDGMYDMKWSFVKELCDYLGVDNPMEVIL